jgi:head-tail adaptor
MRAGSLDRLITIERATFTVGVSGAVSTTWATFATLRAHRIDASTDDLAHASGAVTEATVTYRARFVDGITLDDRLVEGGEVFTIVSIKELGRRAGLELKVRRVGP